MILYHGSYLAIEVPDIIHSRNNVDFGKGFYTTPIYDQAKSWCGKFLRRNREGIISRYRLDESGCGNLKILRFDAYSEESQTTFSHIEKLLQDTEIHSEIADSTELTSAYRTQKKSGGVFTKYPSTLAVPTVIKYQCAIKSNETLEKIQVK